MNIRLLSFLLAGFALLVMLPSGMADEGPGPQLGMAGSYDTSGYAQDVAVSGGDAYIADGNNGLVVVDVSDPTDPVRVGGYYDSNYAQGVAVSGDYAYVADGTGGLVVVDVSDPPDPTWVGGYDASDYAYGVAVSGGYAYVADRDSGLVVVDVSDPANPTRAGGYDTGSAQSVAVAGGYAYVADGSGGLVVLEPDSDGDGVADVYDLFPSDPEEWADTDGDGVGDNGDPMPNNALLSAWWQVGLILLVLIASGAAASYRYSQYTLARRVSGKVG